MELFTPIVGGDGLPQFLEAAQHFSQVILPYYEHSIDDRVAERIREANPGIKLILSSIMPDEYLEAPGIFKRFTEYARRHGFDYVLAWDVPTYLDTPEKNAEKMSEALERIDALADEFRVIPLVKGATLGDIRRFASELWDRGYRVAAFHASQYLTTQLSPYPELRGVARSFKEYLGMIIQEILDTGFEELLLIGVARPSLYREYLYMDGRIRLAGYSWFIDGSRYRCYTPAGYIVDMRDRFYICTCPSCDGLSPSQLRTRERIIRHNLVMNKLGIEAEHTRVWRPRRPIYEVYDLVLETHEDLAIVNELIAGHPESLWLHALEKVRRIRPTYLVITGRLLHRNIDRETVARLVETLEKLSRHTRIYLVSRDGTARILRMLRHLYLEDTDLLANRLSSTRYGEELMKLSRLLLTARRRRMFIRKNLWSSWLELKIELHGSIDAPLDEIYKVIGTFHPHRFNWLILDLSPKPHIDRDRGIAMPGEYHRHWAKYEAPEPGILHLRSDGDLELIRPYRSSR